MKKILSLLVFLFILSFIPDFAEEYKIWKVKPVKIDRNKAAEKMAGHYRSENKETKNGVKIYRYNGLDGSRVRIGDDGSIQVVQTAGVKEINQELLYSKISDMLDRLELKVKILTNQIKWTYRDYTNLVSLTGIKLVEGLEVVNGDRVEINAMRTGPKNAEFDLKVRWYETGKMTITNINLDQKSKNIVRSITNTDNNKIDKNKQSNYVYKNGYYYPVMRLIKK